MSPLARLNAVPRDDAQLRDVKWYVQDRYGVDLRRVRDRQQRRLKRRLLICCHLFHGGQ